MTWHALMASAELAEGQSRECQLEDTALFLVRHRGVVHAYRNRCPHLGIELNWAPNRFLDLDKRFIQCSTHGALFKIQDGHCIAGPCQGEALTALGCREGDGQIWVQDESI
ncbi:Rieske 2Fe-2S domain-containing protein [Marinobacteraceae bacterium S3BR75-40.1]